MNIEYEATFLNVDKNKIRNQLREIGAKLIKPNFLQKRVVFSLPQGHEIPGGWLRVRDEQDKITMSLKVINGDKIEDQKEICLKINDFSDAVLLLNSIGCQEKAYQESYRELWVLDNTEITIDEWPYLEPYVEVEGESEKIVKEVSEKLGFDYEQAVFGSVDLLYNKKYGTPIEKINNKIPRITFDEPNPFLNNE